MSALARLTAAQVFVVMMSIFALALRIATMMLMMMNGWWLLLFAFWGARLECQEGPDLLQRHRRGG